MANEKKKLSGKIFPCAVAAVTLVISFIASFFALNIASDAAAASAAEARIDAAVTTVKDYSSNKSRLSFEFYDKIYSKAGYVASQVDDTPTEQELSSLAKGLELDSIIVVDENGNCTAAYPEGQRVKNIRKNSDLSTFMKVVKGLSYKLSTVPKPVEDSENEFLIYAGIRPSDRQGAVIVAATVDNYNEIIGADLAEKCGYDIVITEDKAVVSSSVKGVDPSDISAESLAKGTEVSFGDKTYSIKSETVDEYTVYCLSEKGSSGNIAALVVGIVDLLLILAAAAVLMLSGFFTKFFDIKFWKFLMVGILNTVVGMGLQFLFYNLFGWNEWISSIIGYFLGSVLSYFLNKYFTFQNKEKGIKPIIKFAVNIAVCYGLAYGIAIPLVKMFCLSNAVTMFGWSVETFAGNFSMLAGSCLFVAFNYIGQRFFAFKEKKTEE